MYTIREGIEKIRSLASAWLTDQTTDGSTAMGEVAATLLNTNFEDVQYVNVRQPSDEELLAEIENLSKRALVAKPANIYEGITSPDVLVRLESRINAAEHPPGTWADNRQRMGSICTKNDTALSPLAIENGWASFSFKRDAWLAVEAVNALPELIARVRSAEAGEHAADAEVERLQGLLAADKSIGTEACAQVISTCEEQTPALRDVAAERLRQVSVEGRSPEEDAQYTNGELADAAGCYAMHADENPEDLEAEGIPAFWPWEAEWWKPTDRRRNLVKAGALILAEIERLDRLSAAKPAELYTAADEARMDVVGQNGNDGEHYGISDGWIEWTGELCPVDDLDAMVWVQLEGVNEVRPGIARNWDWRTEPAMGRSRIVAYTLKDPAKAARA